MKQLRRLPEFLRFVLVGVFATALHYGIYFLLQKFINVNIAYTLGYAFSFIANFYLTAYFTFGKNRHGEKRSVSAGLIYSTTFAHWITEYISLAWPFQDHCPCSGVRHSHSGKLFISTLCF